MPLLWRPHRTFVTARHYSASYPCICKCCSLCFKSLPLLVYLENSYSFFKILFKGHLLFPLPLVCEHLLCAIAGLGPRIHECTRKTWCVLSETPHSRGGERDCKISKHTNQHEQWQLTWRGRMTRNGLSFRHVAREELSEGKIIEVRYEKRE